MTGGLKDHINSAIARWEPDENSNLAESLEDRLSHFFRFKDPLNSTIVDDEGLVRYEPGPLPYIGISEVPLLIAESRSSSLENVKQLAETLQSDHRLVYILLVGFSPQKASSALETDSGNNKTQIWSWESREDIMKGEASIKPDSLQGAGNFHTI